MMEEVHMTLNGEHFSWTEMPSDVIDKAIARPDDQSIDLYMEDGKVTFKTTMWREADLVILDMVRIH